MLSLYHLAGDLEPVIAALVAVLLRDEVHKMWNDDRSVLCRHCAERFTFFLRISVAASEDSCVLWTVLLWLFTVAQDPNPVLSSRGSAGKRKAE